jgi:2-polyprenyl-3-methyl-5-hydroxy-6-metoxy-1,4-benzoquinol methylase
MSDWWQGFFDAEYLRLWGQGDASGSVAAAQSDGLWSLLGLQEGRRVLDAPCGYGRLSRPLAERGAIVLGVDQSQALLDHAERERGSLPAPRLRYVRHDLRQPLAEEGFDCAINVFTSLGYGSEEDDLAILDTLRGAVRPGGLVFVETNHRDLMATFLARGVAPS